MILPSNMMKQPSVTHWLSPLADTVRQLLLFSETAAIEDRAWFPGRAKDCNATSAPDADMPVAAEQHARAVVIHLVGGTGGVSEPS